MILPDKKILFVHIPKCGGSSVAAGLFHSIGVNYKTYISLNKGLTHTHLAGLQLKHAPASVLKDKMPDYDEYYKFAIIRNPWDRLISSYVWANTKSVSEVSINKHLNKARQKHEADNNIKHYQYIDMKRFVTDNNGNIIVDDIFCLSQLNKVFEKLDLKRFHKKERNSRNKINKRFIEKFDTTTREIYKDDIEFFGYTKGSAATKNVSIL